MVFISLFVFTTLLSSNAYCPEDVPRASVTRQRTVLPTISKRLSDIARKEIIEALTTGQPKSNSEFENVLKNLLLWNISSRITDNDLALFTSAVIARHENPRHQNGIDMIADLLSRVENITMARPYLILTLCNARAVLHKHLERLVKYSAHTNYTYLRDLELNALVLKTLACAASLEDARQRKLDVFNDCMQDKAEKLRSSMSNGYFDVYSTSLYVMALTAYNRINPDFQWKKKEALEALRKESTSDSVTKMYYITMALNAQRVPFIKDLHKQSYDSQIILKRDKRVTVSLQNEGSAAEYFAVQLKVPGEWNLLEIMFKASNFSTRFQFTYIDYQGFFLLEVDDTQNDPERGLYWAIYEEPRKICSKSLDPTSHIPGD